jgi:hypothetical protein
LPLDAFNAGSPHLPGIASPEFVPTSRFLTPSWAFSSLRLAGLFHPASVYWLLPFRGFPFDGAVCTSSVPPRPPDVFSRIFRRLRSDSTGRSLRKQLASYRSLSRLQGCEPLRSPYPTTSLLSSPKAVPLLGFLLPKVSPCLRMERFSPLLLPHAWALPALELPRVRAGPAPRSIVPQARWHCLSRGRLPFTRFIADVQVAPLIAPGPGFRFTSSSRWRHRSL